MSAFLLSFGISYILYYVASLAIGIIFAPIVMGNYDTGTVIDYNKPIYLIIYCAISALQILLSVLMFRIRRFRKGFPFLLRKYAVVVTLIASGTVLVLVSTIKLSGQTEDVSMVPVLFVGILVIGIGIAIWIRRSIKNAYLRRAKENNEALLRQELLEKDLEIQRYKELHEAVRTANHSMNHRLAAWERSMTRLLSGMQSSSIEVSGELAIAMQDIQRLSREYRKEIDEVKSETTLPSTAVLMIDNLFAHFAAKFAENDIAFALKVNGSILHMIKHCISQSQLETLIGDHLQDALIAVNASDNPVRSVLAVLGANERCYEFKVYDSGIFFEVDTLVRLGTERITTHADTGGSGTGFMTTFQTLELCNASLIIQENHTGASAFTKSVEIQFDGKNQYIIKTNRPDKFPVSERYILAKV